MAEISGNTFIYKDSSFPIEERVKDLLSRMTVKEKLGQMTQILQTVATPSSLKDLGIGSVYSEAGKAPSENATVTEWAEMVDNLQKSAMESRLGIPIIYGIDAVHGHNSVYGATIFPHNVNIGAARYQHLIFEDYYGKDELIILEEDLKKNDVYDVFKDKYIRVRKIDSQNGLDRVN